MRPGLPDPLIDLLGARWALGAPVTGVAWFASQDTVAFGLADGTVAIARTHWEGAPRVQPREGGGVELIPTTEPAPPVMRVGVHEGPCLAIAADGSGGILSGGVDGRLACVAVDGSVETLASFADAPIDRVAAAGQTLRACAVGSKVHILGPATAHLDLPGRVAALAFSPDGHHLAIAHQGGVTLWSADATEARLLPQAGTHRALAWSPDGRHLVSGLEENAAHGWRVADGASFAMDGYAGSPLSLSFSAPGGYFATSGGGRVVCWRIEEQGDRAGRTECGVGSKAGVTQVACNPVRNLIAVGYENGAVLLCQPDSSDIVFVRGAGGGEIRGLSWSANGGSLALGNASGEVGVVVFPEHFFRAAPAPAQRSSER